VPPLSFDGGAGRLTVEGRDHESVTKVEILTVEYHLTGYVRTGGRRFSTWLNLGEVQTPKLENVALKSLCDPDRPEVFLRYVVVNRGSILAVIPREAPSAGPAEERDQRPLEYVVKEPHDLVVSVPPFAARGQMHIAKDADLQRALASLTGAFMPLTEARIVYLPNPKQVWHGGVILVSRDKAQLYWAAPEEEG
jgi:hypothetical protein